MGVQCCLILEAFTHVERAALITRFEQCVLDIAGSARVGSTSADNACFRADSLPALAFRTAIKANGFAGAFIIDTPVFDSING